MKAGYIKKIKSPLALFFLAFLLFCFPFNYSLREGRAIFAYNMKNLGRSVTEKLVQSPAFEIDRRQINSLRIF